ncbi:MAG: 23S rRNA (uracil(1939)-C(5))-methyltransferase RlmD [Oscillospiraceae bacterium]|nr:23S rRNA (uracil(1939)-C(5))-methyltransferase RlmD [Oscillospiraceae bacterium]
MTKNDIFTAKIIDYNSEGMGVCRHEGHAVFVRGAARGDIAAVKVISADKKAVWGRIEELITPSEQRVSDDCAVFPKCGSCDLRHISYDEELRFKVNKAEQALKRIGGVELSANDIIGADSVGGYRNKAVIPIGGNEIAMGYYRSRTHDIVPYLECKTNAPQINDCARVTREFLEKYNIRTARHLMVRATEFGVQAALVVNGGLDNSDAWVSDLRENCRDIKSILVIENPRADNVLLAGSIKTLWGELTLDERLGEFVFELHPFAFAQVNTKQAVKLYNLASEYIGDCSAAADLYCGTGTLTLWTARRAEKVFGVEIVAESVECAKRNAKRNGVVNAEFFLGDAGTVKLPQRVEAVVLDPPRSGLDAKAINAVTALEPNRIVYVSCDPATLARDVKLFAERGFAAEKLGVVDMFPRTRHVECVVLLKCQ